MYIVQMALMRSALVLVLVSALAQPTLRSVCGMDEQSHVT
jgi:hypothetical protein